ncbi:hypothetical protein J2Z19_005740 [Ensifer adhaerens]|uniref:Uncharacterized protein n=1 Tax=Ensifer adhaerens TaxID=106592 RepID=A0ACC5T4D5_ENSAD|nr:hypothetical protein [Ensifer adhaerens]
MRLQLIMIADFDDVPSYMPMMRLQARTVASR